MLPESIERLKTFEEKRLKPYDDATGLELLQGDTLKGKISIGWGRNLSDRGVSYDEAVMLFEHDIEIAATEARENFPWFDSLDFVRRDFIVMMVFNLGMPILKKNNPKMLAAIEAQDWLKAGAELMDGDWHNDVGPDRANAMRHAIEQGHWI